MKILLTGANGYIGTRLSDYVLSNTDKVTRALPISSQAEAGNIKLLQAPWNEDFLRELENFPEGAHDDIVDALSGAFLMLTNSTYDLSALTTF